MLGQWACWSQYKPHCSLFNVSLTIKMSDTTTAVTPITLVAHDTAEQRIAVAPHIQLEERKQSAKRSAVALPESPAPAAKRTASLLEDTVSTTTSHDGKKIEVREREAYTIKCIDGCYRLLAVKVDASSLSPDQDVYVAKDASSRPELGDPFQPISAFDGFMWSVDEEEVAFKSERIETVECVLGGALSDVGDSVMSMRFVTPDDEGVSWQQALNAIEKFWMQPLTREFLEDMGVQKIDVDELTSSKHSNLTRGNALYGRIYLEVFCQETPLSDDFAEKKSLAEKMVHVLSFGS